jgi:hypothetical protein
VQGWEAAGAWNENKAENNRESIKRGRALERVISGRQRDGTVPWYPSGWSAKVNYPLLIPWRTWAAIAKWGISLRAQGFGGRGPSCADRKMQDNGD